MEGCSDVERATCTNGTDFLKGGFDRRRLLSAAGTGEVRQSNITGYGGR